MRELEGSLFSIMAADDLRSFTKIVPALTAYPDSFIVIADDDVHYSADWLKGLVDAYDPGDPTIVYYRGHRPVYCPDGSLAPYRSWQREVNDDESAIARQGCHADRCGRSPLSSGFAAGPNDRRGAVQEAQ